MTFINLIVFLVLFKYMRKLFCAGVVSWERENVLGFLKSINVLRIVKSELLYSTSH